MYKGEMAGKALERRKESGDHCKERSPKQLKMTVPWYLYLLVGLVTSVIIGIIIYSSKMGNHTLINLVAVSVLIIAAVLYLSYKRRLKDLLKIRKTEKDLLYAAEEWRSTFDAISDMLSIHSKDFKIIRVNKAFAEAHNMEPSEVIGKHCYELIHGTKGPPFYCPCKKTFEEGRPNYAEEFEPNLGIYVAASTSPLFDKNGQIRASIHIAKDITERKQAEEQLEKAMHEVEAANIAKSQFLANMSHEIRTPLNAIMGFTDILADEELTETQNEYIKIIHNSSEHLLQLIEDILDLSKIEAGKMGMELSECSLASLLAMMGSMMNPSAVEKGLKFEIRTDSSLPANICTDQARLRQCLINLIGNAIKFTEQGYVSLNVSLEDKDGQSFIRFDVEDTGIGIPAEMHEAIFNPFTQVDETHSRKYGGTGLGLAITKHMVQLLGGEISFTSQEGKGSVFSILIPAELDVMNHDILEIDCISQHVQSKKMS